jgi:hypothetical protein
MRQTEVGKAPRVEGVTRIKVPPNAMSEVVLAFWLCGRLRTLLSLQQKVSLYVK